MLLLMSVVLCLVAVMILLLPLTLWRVELFRRYSSARAVDCPENHQAAAVEIDAWHASESGNDGCPELRLCDCTRWPERAQCDQGCLKQALEAGPWTANEVKIDGKQIYHLPILLAAFAAWVLGALWHSQHAFRTRWMEAVGLPPAEVKQIVWWVWPHLLTFAVWLLFAYGVAWLLVLGHRKGVLQGVAMALLLCAALIIASGYSIAQLPRDLIVIEAGYTALAILAVGAIVGGLYNKRVLPS